MSQAVDILKEIDRRVASNGPLIVERVTRMMEKQILKGHKMVSECPYCHHLREYSKLRIRESKIIRALKNEEYHGWHYTRGVSGYVHKLYEELHYIQTDIVFKKQIKDRCKNL
ncbi:unnamed protein product [marine sediment metagenome]|uniref:Uncharacterized protein n=1 Tax=marine sediment metagenome TaxID=412755 RepID=X0WTU9_9ZZZZ